MPTAVDTHGTGFKNGSVTCMARVVGADAANITQSDISTGVYSVYLLDDQDSDSRTAVTGHAAVSLTVADVIFDTLQTEDDRWTEDSTGYNFRYTLDVSSNEAFAIAGRNYLIEFTLTPASGQKILVRFQVGVI